MSETPRLDAWIQKTVGTYGAPDGFPKDMLYDKDPKSRRLAAWALNSALEAREHSKEKPSEMVHLIPEKMADGSFALLDRYKGHVVARIDRMPNGMFSFYGPKEYVTFFGGRGEFGGIADKMADGEYFNKG